MFVSLNSLVPLIYEKSNITSKILNSGGRGGGVEVSSDKIVCLQISIIAFTTKRTRPVC